MCRLCLTRRSLLAAPAAFVADAPVEPHMRLAAPPAGGLAVALTFDACPGGFDARVADALIALRIPATLFVTGLWLRWNREALARLLEHRDLFAFENHGARHLPPVLGARRIFGLKPAGDLEAIRREIAEGADDIEAATGTRPRWYRAAAGFYSPAVLPGIGRMGFAIGAYTTTADAGASLPAAQVAARMAAARNGDVLVAHINQPHRASGAGVAEGLRALQRRGATFLRLDRLRAADMRFDRAV